MAAHEAGFVAGANCIGKDDCATEAVGCIGTAGAGKLDGLIKANLARC